MRDLTRVFVHGLESSAHGTKGVYFTANFPDMIVEDYFGSAGERLAKLTKLLNGKDNIIIVGSSYGGLIGAMYACENSHRMRRLILLAPALDVKEFADYREMTTPVETFLFHGANDDAVAPVSVKQIARSCFPNLKYHLVNDDHPLTATFPLMDWNALLRA